MRGILYGNFIFISGGAIFLCSKSTDEAWEKSIFAKFPQKSTNIKKKLLKNPYKITNIEMRNSSGI